MNIPHLAPDFANFGQYFGVSIATRPADVHVVWLNERWWALHAVDVAEPEERRALTEAIKQAMGVTTHGAHTPADPPFVADRYGDTIGSYHGGSGRCASIGTFSAKGIGPTPLVPNVDTGTHRDGRVSIIEAMREAASAEIAEMELPHGAIPVVAILRYENPEFGDAIVVRPNFIRPAHFLRSIYFGTAGFPGSDQHLDGLRVAHNVRRSELKPSAFGFPGFATMIERLAHQVGAAHALRLWQGRFLPANASVTGALADFGSFRGVPSWHRYFGDPDEFFGEEAQGLLRASRALFKSFSKHSQSSIRTLDEKHLMTAVRKGFDEAIRVSLCLPLDNSGEKILDLLHSYFKAQQLETGHIGYSETLDRKPWIHETLVQPALLGSDRYRAERELIENLRHLIDQNDFAHRLAAWTMPRPKLSYERPYDVFTRFFSVAKNSPEEVAKRIEFAINRIIATSVRNWPDLPVKFRILGQTYRNGSIAVYGRLSGSDDLTVCVRGVGMRRFFGTRVPSSPSATRDTEWHLVKASSSALGNGLEASIEGVRVEVPAAKQLYPQIHVGE